MFSNHPITNFKFSVTFILSSVNTVNLYQFMNLSFDKELTHSHTMTPFDSSRKDAFWKHYGKRKKNACTSNFSISHTVFYSIKDRNSHFCYIKFVISKCFQNFVVWEWVKHIIGKFCLVHHIWTVICKDWILESLLVSIWWRVKNHRELQKSTLYNHFFTYSLNSYTAIHSKVNK